MTLNVRASSQAKPLLRVLQGEHIAQRPVWLMRQAGRYLPEYRDIRGSAKSFLDFCYSPKLASEATLQPIRRFGFDGAILFSDILVIPDALGQEVSFEVGEGPRLKPIETAADLARLHDRIDLKRLAPVFETIQRVRPELPADVAFLGFCGAPWTVASYMIAGRGTPDQAPARLFAYRFPDLMERLIDKLIDASIAYLNEQIAAGVDAVQIFDSWAGVLPAGEFDKWCLIPLQKIIGGVRSKHRQAKIIAFPRGAASHLVRVARLSGADMIGLDTAVDPVFAQREVQSLVPVQGNLDPLALLAGGKALDHAVDGILKAFAKGGHVFNLGHGILPETPIAHVEQMLKRIRTFSEI
ncbi:uroporphyrinogen decarboxylase [Methylovirgula sp. 4M-Z18]|uniref:uroporphyrinogen decarboxylase n=1 Tax=Methylovirgula sp. 4M-Z18 TaxID=2293567 RepID=UPI000E2ED4CB|nr:uroporphyrinogen decarboxylase [Methylovirgula sp. 4M-Z18]RFB78046.1 uroporphyrinogen decarboxylase [Methylovirgula sp. 4M-Z18]